MSSHFKWTLGILITYHHHHVGFGDLGCVVQEADEEVQLANPEVHMQFLCWTA